MLIGVDAHNLESNRTGVGRYLFNLLREWSFVQTYHTIEYDKFTQLKFILYFKDEIPSDIPKVSLFESKLLKVSSTAKFVHWDLPWQARKDKVDVLFCPGYVAPIFYRGKIALVLHDIIYEAHPTWFNWKSPADKIFLKWVSKKAAKKAAAIFTCSEFSKQEIIKYYRVSEKKVIVNYLAVDEILIGDKKYNFDEIKQRYKIKDKFIFFVGSLFSRRHLPETIESFYRIAREYSDYQFLIGGKNYTRPLVDIDKLIEEKNAALGNRAILRVDFIGDSDLKLLYSACAFFVWLSDYEGFGLPPLEAMSCGAPVITSDSTSLKEVAGEAALFIKNNSDAEEIYRAMKRLVEDENLRQELIRRGREQTIKFSWRDCAKKTLEVLKMI